MNTLAALEQEKLRAHKMLCHVLDLPNDTPGILRARAYAWEQWRWAWDRWSTAAGLSED